MLAKKHDDEAQPFYVRDKSSDKPACAVCQRNTILVYKQSSTRTLNVLCFMCWAQHALFVAREMEKVNKNTHTQTSWRLYKKKKSSNRVRCATSGYIPKICVFVLVYFGMMCHWSYYIIASERFVVLC